MNAASSRQTENGARAPLYGQALAFAIGTRLGAFAPIQPELPFSPAAKFCEKCSDS